MTVYAYRDGKPLALGNALDKVLLNLKAFADETEREHGKARTRDAHERKAKAGHVTGGLVYGYTNERVGSHVERRPHPVEADVVRRIFQLYADGLGPRGIATQLRNDGAPPPKPRQSGATPGWSRAAVSEMLKRELYRGVMAWGKRGKVDRRGTKVRERQDEASVIRVHDERLRLVAEDLWRAVHARRQTIAASTPAGTWTRSEAKPALLAGVAVCATCGAGITRVSRSHGSGLHRRRVLLYGCGQHVRNRAQCDNAVALPEDVLDREVLVAFGESLSPAVIEAALDLALADHKAEQAAEGPRRRQLDRDLLAIKTRIEVLTEAVATSAGSLPSLLAKLTTEEHRRVELQRERDALDVAAKTTDLFTAKMRKAIVRAAGEVKAALLDDREGAAEVLKAFVPQIRCTPFGAGHGRGYDFEGTGDYGALIGQTLARRGVPDGIRTRVARLKIWSPRPA